MPPKTQPDFKRIKAKVGRRAPKPANDTDTSFRKAGLVLSKQHAVQATAAASDASTSLGEHTTQDLMSSRGRSLTELTAQLQHPASAVRISAAKGLEDILVRANAAVNKSKKKSTTASNNNNTQEQINQVLSPHVALFAQACARSCVDEEADCRALGLTLLEHLLNTFPVQLLQPFAHLLLTFVASALNSLDKAARLDGAQAVALLARKVPSLVRSHVPTLLPTFVRLLADFKIAKKQEPNEKNIKKRKRMTAAAAAAANGGNRDSTRVGVQKASVLEALMVLLETTATTSTPSATASGVDGSYADHYSDLTIAPNGRSCHALLVQGPPLSQKRSRCVISTLQDLPTFEFAQSTNPANNNTTDAGASAVTSALLTKLRDKYVEVTQRGHTFSNQGLRLSWEDLESTYQIVRSIRLFREYLPSTATTDEKRDEKLANLLLEQFPVYDDGSSKSRAPDVNTEICRILMLIANSTNQRKWIKPVANCVEEALLLDGEKEEDDQQDAKTATASESSQVPRISFQTLSVLRQLLLLPTSFWKDEETPHMLVSLLCRHFFASDVDVSSLATSHVGREAVLLVADLLQECEYSLGAAKRRYSSKLNSTIDQLPCYLTEWKNVWPAESARLIQVFSHLVQRASLRDAILPKLKEKLEPIVDSIEDYPTELHRQIVCLVALLGSPTDAAVKSLGRFCARSKNQYVSSFVVFKIHHVRKSMRMASYLGFLFDATGLMSLTAVSFKKAEFRQALEMDNAIADSAFCLAECGTRKVLPMIQSILKSLLTKFGDAFFEFVRARGAIAILATLALDLSTDNAKESICNILPPELLSQVLDRVSDLLHFSQDQEQPLEGTWARPVVALLSCDEMLFLQVVEGLAGQLDGSDSTRQTRVVNLLLALVQNPSLNGVVQARIDQMLSLSQRLYGMFPDAPLEDLTGRLVSHIKVAQEIGLQ